MIYFISDHHFFDDGIIKYEKRPFLNSEEMTEELINLHNSEVGFQDTVYFLGDVFWGNNLRENKSRDIMERMNGNKILVLGNHDKEDIHFYYDCGFDFISPYPIILDEFVILSHKPIYLPKDSLFRNIYGHVHGDERYIGVTDKSACVCVERTNYKPISYIRIKKMWEKREERLY